MRHKIGESITYKGNAHKIIGTFEDGKNKIFRYKLENVAGYVDEKEVSLLIPELPKEIIEIPTPIFTKRKNKRNESN